MQSMSQYGLEILKVLAGIANAERVDDDNRKLANEAMTYILKDVKKELVQESLESQGINLQS